MRSTDYVKLAVSIVLVQVAGFVGAIFTAPSIPGWYQTLAKPELAPPNWVFAPVWTTLYLLMGVAVFLVWKAAQNNKLRQRAIWVFGAQLALNVLWSLIFFGWQNPGWALADLAVLWVAILATIIVFRRISVAASWMLVPYLAWVSFAGYLNYMIFVLNG